MSSSCINVRVDVDDNANAHVYVCENIDANLLRCPFMLMLMFVLVCVLGLHFVSLPLVILVPSCLCFFAWVKLQVGCQSRRLQENVSQGDCHQLRRPADRHTEALQCC